MSELRTALVTGATSGIGRGVALRLREMGMAVLALGRNRAALEALAGECGAEPVVADMRDAGAIAERLAGREIDLLVSNAGVLTSRAPFFEIDPADIDAMIDVNLKAPMHLTRALLPGMLARRRGHLIFMGSMSGRAPYGNMGAYGPSKAGLSMFCDNLRLDLAGSGIRVSELAPGRVETALYHGAMGEKGARTALYEGFRPIRPEHIAELVATIVALPSHVDVTRIEVLPTDQVVGGGSMVKFAG